MPQRPHQRTVSLIGTRSAQILPAETGGSSGMCWDWARSALLRLWRARPLACPKAQPHEWANHAARKTDRQRLFGTNQRPGPLHEPDTEGLSERNTISPPVAMVFFQNPDSTMNPSYTVGQQIGRPMVRFGTVPRSQVRDEVIKLLQSMRLGANYYDRLPRQLSGGEKQRVGIARHWPAVLT
ncbi:ATP-binding cassette domain-containing protein [Promineifilum sp.]|uniref:ATP-binding cassette domain-containing protein n=1 Tax=Promineifilum sp. TaxID=2664178 RepID=UPI0031CC3C10